MTPTEAEIDLTQQEMERLQDANAELRMRRNDINVALAKSKRDYFAGKGGMDRLEHAQAELDLAELERDLSANNWKIEKLVRRIKELRYPAPEGGAQ